jgi:hypothetical protein
VLEAGQVLATGQNEDEAMGGENEEATGEENEDEATTGGEN